MKKILFAVLLPVLMIAQTGDQKRNSYVTMDSLIRPVSAATAALTYTANDVVNDSATVPDIFRFKHAGRDINGNGIIAFASLEIDTANITSGSFRLLLFNDTVATVADNSAWVPSYPWSARKIAAIDFALDMNQSAGAGMASAEVTNLVIPFQTAEVNGYIYGVLLAKAAYKANAAGKIRIKLGIVRE